MAVPPPSAHEPQLTSLSRTGPQPVGVLHLRLRDPERPERELPTEVWYPAENGGRGAPAAHPLNLPHAASEGLAAAPGSHPLLVFSHGNSGLRHQSTFLTTHLASWGFVVAAPDHTGNTFFEMLSITDEDERRRCHLEARQNRPRDLSTVLDALVADGAWGAVDRQRIGAVGHSFGGWTAFKMPRRDERVRAVCGLAPASEPFVGRKAFEPGELPLALGIPALVVAGLDDVLVDLTSSVWPLFERLAPPRALVGLAQSDHFHFCDGIEFLHGLHLRNERPNLPRPVKPYSEQLPQSRSHAALRAVVTHFFRAALAGAVDDACGALAPGALAAVDPALQRLDPVDREAAA